MTYIEANDRNPFGDDFDESILQDGAKDSTWLQGYSDKRIERELALRKGEKVLPLQHRFHLARAKTEAGKTNGQRVFHWQSRKGYSSVQWNEETFKELGIDPTENPAYYKGEDGLVYNGSNVLMVAPKEVAAANFARVQDELEAQRASAANRMADAGAEYAATTGGASPTFATQDNPRTGEEVEDRPTTAKRGPGRPKKQKKTK